MQRRTSMRRAVFLLMFTALVGCAKPYGDAAVAQRAAPRRRERCPIEPRKPAPKSSRQGSRRTSGRDRDGTATSGTADDADVRRASTATPNAPSSVSFTWNRVTPTAQYSFDVLPTGEAWVGPCVSVDYIERRLTLTFSGDCLRPGTTVAMSDIQDFRVCWAENGNWPAAHCSSANWDGSSADVSIDPDDARFSRAAAADS